MLTTGHTCNRRKWLFTVDFLLIIAIFDKLLERHRPFAAFDVLTLVGHHRVTSERRLSVSLCSFIRGLVYCSIIKKVKVRERNVTLKLWGIVKPMKLKAEHREQRGPTSERHVQCVTPQVLSLCQGPFLEVPPHSLKFLHTPTVGWSKNLCQTSSAIWCTGLRYEKNSLLQGFSNPIIQVTQPQYNKEAQVRQRFFDQCKKAHHTQSDTQTKRGFTR